MDKFNLVLHIAIIKSEKVVVHVDVIVQGYAVHHPSDRQTLSINGLKLVGLLRFLFISLEQHNCRSLGCEQVN